MIIFKGKTLQMVVFRRWMWEKRGLSFPLDVGGSGIVPGVVNDFPGTPPCGNYNCNVVVLFLLPGNVLDAVTGWLVVTTFSSGLPPSLLG